MRHRSGIIDTYTGKEIELPSDCEREPIAEAIGFNRAELDYIDQQICQAVDTALNTLSKAMADTKTSNVDAFRNVALQLALNFNMAHDRPISAAQVVEDARRYHSFLKGT